MKLFSSLVLIPLFIISGCTSDSSEPLPVVGTGIGTDADVDVDVDGIVGFGEAVPVTEFTFPADVEFSPSFEGQSNILNGRVTLTSPTSTFSVTGNEEVGFVISVNEPQFLEISIDLSGIIRQTFQTVPPFATELVALPDWALVEPAVDLVRFLANSEEVLSDFEVVNTTFVSGYTWEGENSIIEATTVWINGTEPVKLSFLTGTLLNEETQTEVKVSFVIK